MLDRGEPAAAVAWAERVIAAAPWQEQGYQALMRAYARQGQRARALRVYDQAAAALERELAVEPSALTRWLRERLQRGEGI